MGQISQRPQAEWASRRNGPELAIFIPSLVGGGAERVMVNLALGFAERGIPLHLVLARACGPLLDQVRGHPRIDIVDLKSRRTIGSLLALTRYLRRVQPSCLISALDHANLVALWANRLSSKPVRHIVTVHNQRSLGTAHSRVAKVHLLPVMMRSFYPWAHRVVAVSHGVADDLVENVGLSRSLITTIYNPVISDKLLELAEEEPDHPWLKDGRCPTILAIGRLAEQKDFESLIRAFHLVQSERAVRLLILGEGPERRKLEVLAAELGLKDKISMPGFVENPYAYLKRASAFVLSSRWEGLPTVLIEALALGIPLVSTDCPSGPREIMGAGKYGKLVPVGDVEAMARGIFEALDSSPGSLPSEVSRPFHADTSMKSYIDLGRIRLPQQENGAIRAGTG